LDLSGYRLLDMTHTFSKETLYWPTGKHFEHEQVAWGKTAGGYWYSSSNYGANEHGGTHVDAPVHFAEGTRSVDQIPLEQLVGPAVVIDVTAGARNDPDYLASVADIEAFEKQHGAIEPDAIVLIRSGWGGYWPDAKKYLGDDTPGAVENLHFPGLSPEAAKVLVERKIAVVGIDTASIDYGATRDFPAHQVLAAAQIAILENVAQLDELPVTGAYLFALPMKIGAGSGGPCQIVGLIK
jgi:kynurenine formamidase